MKAEYFLLLALTTFTANADPVATDMLNPTFTDRLIDIGINTTYIVFDRDVFIEVNSQKKCFAHGNKIDLSYISEHSGYHRPKVMDDGGYCCIKTKNPSKGYRQIAKGTEKKVISTERDGDKVYGSTTLNFDGEVAAISCYGTYGDVRIENLEKHFGDYISVRYEPELIAKKNGDMPVIVSSPKNKSEEAGAQKHEPVL